MCKTNMLSGDYCMLYHSQNFAAETLHKKSKTLQNNHTGSSIKQNIKVLHFSLETFEKNSPTYHIKKCYPMTKILFF